MRPPGIGIIAPLAPRRKTERLAGGASIPRLAVIGPAGRSVDNPACQQTL